MQLPSFIVDRIIRHKTAVHRTPLETYVVRVARTVEDYEAAFRLVHAAYTFLGIEKVRHDGVRVLSQHLLAESTVLVAFEGDQIVGTLTVLEDSRAKLPLDKQYPGALAALRGRDARLVEYASLAVVQRCWGTGVTQLLSMAAYQLAYNYLGASHTVVGVHPRAAPYYRAMFDFRELGGAQGHSELVAPVVGLVQDMVAVQGFMRKNFARPMRTGKPASAHYLSEPVPCISLPPRDLPPEEWKRWKLPRAVFQELFLRKYERVSELDQTTRGMLNEQRSRDTLLHEVSAVRQALAARELGFVEYGQR
jgi:hypothetical protein